MHATTLMTIALLSIFMTGTPSLARAASMNGGSDGGGGNAQSSTRADLDELVSNLDREFWEISDSYLFGREIRISSADLSPALQELTTVIVGKPYLTMDSSVIDYARHLKFKVVDKDCLDGGQPTDSSTLYQKGATVCLSAPRLSKFPKSTLRDALVPLIFHEIAHQFGFGELQARQFQALVSLHLKYRTIYLSALRARAACAEVTSTNISNNDKREILNSMGIDTSGKAITWPVLDGTLKLQVTTTCVMRANSAAESLNRFYNGDLWQPIEFRKLTALEKQILIDYEGPSPQTMMFETVIHALQEPGLTGYTNCPVCTGRNVDPYYLIMLGSKSALELIDQTVAEEQRRI